MKATETYLILCQMDAGEITLQEALKYLNKSINNSCITACLKGRQKTAFGFIWKYKE